MKKTIAILLAVLLLAASVVPAFAEEERIRTSMPDITNSRYAILYEETTDTIMYAKDTYKRNAPASMTKVMTAILVIENDPDLSGETVVSKKAVSSQYCYWMNDDYHLLAGEKVSIKDLMYYFLIHSGNEAGTVLAEYIAGDIDTFIQMMNDKAKELGLEHTEYHDPHGLSDYNAITCDDMLTLCRYAMQYPQFREIVCNPYGTLPASNMHSEPYTYNNWNGVLDPQDYDEYKTGFEQDILGIKSGFTNAAGNNLSCAMRHDDLMFYSVVMHAHDEKNADGRWIEMHYAETAELMKWARSYKKVGVEAGTEIILPRGTKLNTGKNIIAKVEDDVWILAQKDIEPEFSYGNIGTKVKAGDVVGTIIYNGPFGQKSSNLIAVNDAKTSYRLYIGAVLLAIALAYAAGPLAKKKNKK